MTAKPRIYLDSCCFIDVVKEHVGVLPTERTNDVWFIKKILEAHRGGHLIAHTSLIAVGECLAVGESQDVVAEEAKARFRALLTSGQYLQLLHPTPKTPRLIQDFRWVHNLILGSADAIHFASALEIGCTEFVTTDSRIAGKKVAAAVATMGTLGLRVVAAHNTALLPNSFTQGTIHGQPFTDAAIDASAPRVVE